MDAGPRKRTRSSSATTSPSSCRNSTALGSDVEERKDAWKIGGFDVYTTLDLSAQRFSQQLLWDYVPPSEERFELGSAATSLQVSTGNILVMAQNKHFDNTSTGGGWETTAVNFNTTKNYGGSSGFQPGSTYKPFVLLNWLQRGYGINQLVNANARTEPQSSFTNSCGGPYVSTWEFKNFANESGAWSVARATHDSVNGAFVTMAQQLDLCDIGKVVTDLGVKPASGVELDNRPASVLGSAITVAPVTMAAAYAAMASSGIYCKPRAVELVIHPDGRELPGEEVQCHRALDEDIANTALYVLEGVMTQGSGSFTNIGSLGAPTFAKTGTTDKANQLWFTGGTTNVTTSLWLGNIVGDFPMNRYSSNGYTGSSLRNFIWKNITRQLNGTYGGNAFPGPASYLLSGSGITVPDLRGQTIGSATVQLEAAGFTVDVGNAVESSYPQGTVGDMSPGAGALLGTGSKVTLHPSDGSQSGVPDVVGDGTNTYENAKSILNAANFPNVAERCQVLTPDDAPKNGKVVSQDPAAGTTVNRNTEIRVTVGKLAC